MTDFLALFMEIWDFMKNTTVLSFSIGDVSVSLTFLHILIGSAAIGIGIDVLHNIFEW